MAVSSFLSSLYKLDITIRVNNFPCSVLPHDNLEDPLLQYDNVSLKTKQVLNLYLLVGKLKIRITFILFIHCMYIHGSYHGSKE